MDIQAIYLGAEHCSMCRVAKPQFIESCQQAGLKEDVGYMILDADDCDESILEKYNIRNIPSVVIIDSGEVIFKGHAFEGIKRLRELQNGTE